MSPVFRRGPETGLGIFNVFIPVRTRSGTGARTGSITTCISRDSTAIRRARFSSRWAINSDGRLARVAIAAGGHVCERTSTTLAAPL